MILHKYVRCYYMLLHEIVAIDNYKKNACFFIAKILDILFHFMTYSVLAERTANTWRILLHNDSKSRHRRIKKQRHYERSRCNTSQLCLWVMRGQTGPVGTGRVGTRTHLTNPPGGCYSHVFMSKIRMSPY